MTKFVTSWEPDYVIENEEGGDNGSWRDWELLAERMRGGGRTADAQLGTETIASVNMAAVPMRVRLSTEERR